MTRQTDDAGNAEYVYFHAREARTPATLMVTKREEAR